MKRQETSIAIIGAGLGGAAAAALLVQAGYTVSVYEQAPAFERIGGGIHLTPNVMKIMRRIGIEDRLRAQGMMPANWFSRDSATGDVLLQLSLGSSAERRYGAPYLTMHRGDFHGLLNSATRSGTIRFNKRLIDLDRTDGALVRLRFHDGSEAEADIVIGADGLNSRVREILMGPARPLYAGHVAHRSVIPVSRLQGLQLDDCAKWWSADRHIVVYYLTRARDEICLVTGVPQDDWELERPFVHSTRSELLTVLDGYHTDIQNLIRTCLEVTKWPLMERSPLPTWRKGRIVLLGDACHPMKPHMAQGAAMAIEDAVVLERCLGEVGVDQYEDAFKLYETTRIGRTSKVQQGSRSNTWLRDQLNGDPDWVFSYDAFEVPLLLVADRL